MCFVFSDNIDQLIQHSDQCLIFIVTVQAILDHVCSFTYGFNRFVGDWLQILLDRPAAITDNALLRRDDARLERKRVFALHRVDHVAHLVGQGDG
jgi:hypothetical protein